MTDIKQFDFGKKRKLKPKRNIIPATDTAATDTQTTDEPATAIYPYTYPQLLKRLFSFKDQTIADNKVFTMRVPIVFKEGTRKTLWTNFSECCTDMNRETTHVISFVSAETGSTCNLDGSERLVIRGKFNAQHITTILRNYISEYVKCNTCKSPNTNLQRDKRLTFMLCDNCGSKRSVSPVKVGFHATTSASRHASRA